MTHVTFSPPYIRADQAADQLRSHGYAVLPPAEVAAWIGATPAQLQTLAQDWSDLPPDEHLKDGGRYRRRRHSCFIAEDGRLQQVAHRAHWQPVEYNALHGGMLRMFAPMHAHVVAQPAWQQLLIQLGHLSDQVFLRDAPPAPWFIESHQFRIDTQHGIGRPTPEGAHRDGVDLVAVFLVARENVKGGETRVFEASGPQGQRFTLTEPWSLMLLDDARMIHETTPIQPLAAQPAADGGYRDTLVVTCRHGNFQGAEFDAPR